MDTRLVIDLCVLLLYFVVIITIGLRMGRKEENLEDFALGGRMIPWWAVLASIIAAETSAGTFFGAPGEGFALRNYTYAQLAIGTILARIIVSYIFIRPYLRVQGLFDLRVPDGALRDLDQERGLGCLYGHPATRVGCTPLRRRDRTRARL